MCDKGFIWNPSNCQFERDKSSDISEHLDYDNCKRRKKLVDKLVEECTKNIEETKLTKNENKHENKCSSCTVYAVLFSLSFAINIGNAIYFIYYKYMNHNKGNVSKYDCTYQTTL